jgi:hypothetical protein
MLMAALTISLRDEALRMLQREGAILDTAREVTRILREAGRPGVVIGGVAVLLHGHVRTTMDVDVLVDLPLEDIAELLVAHGFEHEARSREFLWHGVPVHLVRPDQTGVAPTGGKEIEGVLIADLAPLIEMKLRSGTKHLVRLQDLADVVGLIRARDLTSAFASQIAKELRPEFRKLVRAVRADRES